MTTPEMIPSNWFDKLTVINEFKLSNAAALKLFAATDAELQVARRLVDRGIWKIIPMTADARAKWVPIVGGTDNPPQVIQSTIAVSVPAAPKTIATRKPVIEGAKRGRSGTKIISALNAIPTTPQSIDAFVAAYGISKTVLRQSKRFLDTPIKVSIKRDKVTGIEMICRK